MSAMSARLVPTAAGNIQLNASVWATMVMAYFLGDANAAQARDYINNHTQANGGAVLSAAAEADIVAMKAVYDALGATDKAEYRDKLAPYAELLQNNPPGGIVTESAWDTLMGI